MTQDTLAIRTASTGDTVQLARGALRRFQVSQGRQGQAGKGALLGLGIGAGAGLALGFAASTESCSGFCPVETGPGEILAVMSILGGAGAAIGALIGSVSSGERWREVGSPVAATIDPITGTGRIGVVLRR